jgi:thioredoxin-like negative regulator of GroEL
VIRNNHDNPLLLDEVQKIFDKARLGDEGLALIRSGKKEAADLMNQGVLLWKTGKMGEAVEWMRNARKALPNNQRILFNAAQIMVSNMQQHGYDELLSLEAYEVLHHVDRLLPGQQRFAQLMEQLAALQPAAANADADPGASQLESVAPTTIGDTA